MYKKNSSDLLSATAAAKRLIITHQIYEPPVHLDPLIKEHGYSVQIAEFSEQIIVSGFIDLDKKQLLLNEIDEDLTQIFTLARALGHLELHSDELFEVPELKVIYQESLGGDQKSFYEKEAICFAMNLLLSQACFEKDVHLTVTALSLKYQVPEFVVKHFLEELKNK